VDKRKTFFKTLDKIGSVESFAGWSADDKDWVEPRGSRGANGRRAQKGNFRRGAGRTGQPRRPATRASSKMKLKKLCLFAGDRRQIEAGRRRRGLRPEQNGAGFALGDALGDRDLPRLLKRLDEELWEKV
jgi:hypothetical protein